MKLSKNSVSLLEQIAKEIRRDAIRMVYDSKSGHLGGSLSAADVLGALYFELMNHYPKKPNWPERDRFVLSKGHAAPALYAALAIAGYFPKKWYKNFRKVDGKLQGHPIKGKVPGIEASTGSLGQGLSIGTGMALAAKLSGKKFRVFVMVSDGELAEGQIWEAAAFASFKKLNNLTAVVDANGYQTIDAVDNILSFEPIEQRWSAFGWQTIEIDGHDFGQILPAFELAKSSKDKPTVIIARTIKGKGVSFMEKGVEFHGKVPTDFEYKAAMKELKND